MDNRFLNTHGGLAMGETEANPGKTSSYYTTAAVVKMKNTKRWHGRGQKQTHLPFVEMPWRTVRKVLQKLKNRCSVRSNSIASRCESKVRSQQAYQWCSSMHGLTSSIHIIKDIASTRVFIHEWRRKKGGSQYRRGWRAMKNELICKEMDEWEGIHTLC